MPPKKVCKHSIMRYRFNIFIWHLYKYQTKTCEMNSEKFKLAFKEIQKRIELPEYLKIICSSLVLGRPDTHTIKETLNAYNINHSIAKVDFLHLIFEYIKFSLEDNSLTEEEREPLIYLKRLFQIQPGDFYNHSKWELEKLITSQLSKIYADNFVTPEEALLKINIQELFDLSFDQMNEYAKKQAIISIQKGTDPTDLDVFFTNDEYFKLKSSN